MILNVELKYQFYEKEYYAYRLVSHSDGSVRMKGFQLLALFCLPLAYATSSGNKELKIYIYICRCKRKPFFYHEDCGDADLVRLDNGVCYFFSGISELTFSWDTAKQYCSLFTTADTVYDLVVFDNNDLYELTLIQKYMQDNGKNL